MSNVRSLMSSELADRFFSELFRVHLKPAGFKKKGRTVIRDRGSFLEHFQFRGSPWNDKSGPWKFQINVGIEFAQLPRMEPDKDFPRTHACDQISKFVPTTEELQLTNANYPALLSELADLLESASSKLEPIAVEILPRCKSEGRQWMFRSREI